MIASTWESWGADQNLWRHWRRFDEEVVETDAVGVPLVAR